MDNKTEAINNCIIEGIRSKKGEGITLIDLNNLEFAVTDFFIICHAGSNRQVDAIADHVKRAVKDQMNETAHNVEGEKNAEWILLDYLNTVVHIFKQDVREIYKLEELWGDATVKHYDS